MSDTDRTLGFMSPNSKRTGLSGTGGPGGSAPSNNLSPRRSTGITPANTTKFLAEMTPILGDAMAAKEVWDESQKDNPNWLLVGALGGATVVGLIPGVGDAAAKLIKEGAKKSLDTVRRIEVDTNTLGSLGGNISLRPVTGLSEWSKGGSFNALDTGSPRQLYHGMSGTLRGNTREFTGDNLTPSSSGDYGPGIYLTDNSEEASNYAMSLNRGFTDPSDSKMGGQVLPLFTNAKNVFSNDSLKDTGTRNKIISSLSDQDSLNEHLEGVLSSLKSGEEVSVSDLFLDGKGDRNAWAQESLLPSIRESGFDSLESYSPRKGINEIVVFSPENIKSSLQGPSGNYRPESPNMSFNKGGLVDPYESENLMEIDPVSGNEIPPGVGPEQVRDDVKANLSEGEYVVPADVVKYFGVAHFEKLRDKAKAGMQVLDEGGRIGGEPSEEPLEMDEGGLVPGKSDFNPMDYKSGFSVGNTPIAPTQAVADPVCPDGYSWDEGSKTCKPVAPAFPTGSSGSSTSNRTPPVASNPNSWMESFSYNDPQELFTQTMASIKTEETETEQSGGVLSTLFSGAKDLISGGLAGGLLGKFMSTTTSARAAANALVLKTSGFPELAAQIESQNSNFASDRGIDNVFESWRDGDVLASNIQSAKGDVINAWSTSAPVPTAAQAPITKDQGFTGSDDTGMPTLTKRNTSGTGQTKTPNLPNTPPPSVSTPKAPTTTTANTPPPGLASRSSTTSSPSTESIEEKRKRGGGFAKGGLVTKRTKKNK